MSTVGRAILPAAGFRPAGPVGKMRFFIWLVFAAPAAFGQTFFIHGFHASALGTLVCSLCHVPVARGSVELKRPGHDECQVCHQADFDSKKALLCAQCHSGAGSRGDLLRFPRYQGTRAILTDFSHARHMDAKSRRDPATGFRADCVFCHKFESDGVRAKPPTHTACGACHSRPGSKPHLSGAMSEAECQSCHAPEDIENPGRAAARHIPEQAISGKYGNIRFSHVQHFRLKEAYRLDCTACHSAIQSSRGLADLTLPPMLDCVACHDTSKKIPAAFRMFNCSVCHLDPVGSVAPPNHMLGVKPPSHTEGFRVHHREEAAARDAKCFVCHQNVTPSLEAKNQCVACHQVMKPASHTARWKDDVHGKLAAFERNTCATCHAADYCIRCHNELPRSHQPLPLFKAGAHAQLAMLNERACLTCHTFENTCSKCHARTLSPRSRR